MINVLERITQLRESRQWSEYELSKRSGVAQSTISSLYRNNNLPTLMTLEAICNAFDMSVEQFLSPEMDTSDLTSGQKEWLAKYDTMGREEREAVSKMIDTFTVGRRRRTER